MIEMAEPKKRKRVRWKTKVISGRISEPTMDAVLEIISEGTYADVTDYLRDIIRKDIEARNISI